MSTNTIHETEHMFQEVQRSDIRSVSPSFILSLHKSSSHKEERRDFFSRVHRPEFVCTSGSIHRPLLHLDFINALIEYWKNTACVCELKHKKFDLPFLPCRIPSSTPSLSEMRSLDSFCLKPAENRSDKEGKKERKRGRIQRERC